jgi:uncharacterized protein YdaU (DUF1376 family)
VSKNPSGMMLWTDAYLADTVHLSTTEHGAYLLLLMAMWRAGGTLPLDEVRLARVCKMRLDQYRRIAPVLMEFFTVEGDRITQKRLKTERDRALVTSAKRVASGSMGGTAKSLKTKAARLANATDLPKQKDSPALPSKTKTKKEGEETHSEKESPSQTSGHSPDGDRPLTRTDQFELFWSRYPNKAARKQALAAFNRVGKEHRVGFDELMAGLERYIASKVGQVDPKFAHAATWLNGDRWTDGPQPKLPLVVTVRAAATREISESEWRLLLESWVKSADWKRQASPPPNDPKTLAPAHLVAEYGIQQGAAHPEVRREWERQEAERVAMRQRMGRLDARRESAAVSARQRVRRGEPAMWRNAGPAPRSTNKVREANRDQRQGEYL